jgi:D-beta-D-heptose 7-phosphate kinase/D-beta-D-heptose 1-phosphate adenosyltransferase
MPKVLAEPKAKAPVLPLKLVTDHQELAHIVRGLQSQGKTVVFMTGCFEILRPGHIRALRDARSRGDFLIIGVHGDDAVRELKGTGRPIQTALERVEVLAAIDCIDYVTIIKEETADQALLTIRPNVVTWGTEYKENTVPERDTILSYGGRIQIVGDRKKRSTADLLRKAKALRRVV